MDNILEYVSTLTAEELANLRNAAAVEEQRRSNIDAAKERADWAARDYARAIGRKDGEPWSSPDGVIGAYAIGESVEYLGSTYINTVPANINPPGMDDSGWRLETPEDVNPPEFDSTRAYSVADSVTWVGNGYRSLVDNNTYSPDDSPSSWVRIGDIQI